MSMEGDAPPNFGPRESIHNTEFRNWAMADHQRRMHDTEQLRHGLKKNRYTNKGGVFNLLASYHGWQERSHRAKSREAETRSDKHEANFKKDGKLK